MTASIVVLISWLVFNGINIPTHPARKLSGALPDSPFNDLVDKNNEILIRYPDPMKSFSCSPPV